jgi:hypothetical protein
LAGGVGARELLWHSQRFQAIALVNAGAFARGSAALETLHRRAEQEALCGHQVLRAYDRVVVLRGGPSSDSDALRAVLALDPADPPSIWSIKVRVLAALGARREAQLALAMRPAADLARLPCDRDYLGTLGALVHAAVGVGALDYAAALYELLAPYSQGFAAHIAFRCEGSVAQLRGMLARMLGHVPSALEQLKIGIVLCERAGLHTCAEEARRELNSLRAESR